MWYILSLNSNNIGLLILWILDTTQQIIDPSKIRHIHDMRWLVCQQTMYNCTCMGPIGPPCLGRGSDELIAEWENAKVFSHTDKLIASPYWYKYSQDQVLHDWEKQRRWAGKGEHFRDIGLYTKGFGRGIKKGEQFQGVRMGYRSIPKVYGLIKISCG